MNSQLLQTIEQKYYSGNDFNSFNVGDTIKVHNTIREGGKTRTQIFQGVVISKKGSGTRATFTVRKISDGVGVEKIFPVHSPNVEKIDIVRRGDVKRAKLYFLRERVGKSATKVNLASSEKIAKTESYIEANKTVEPVADEQIEAEKVETSEENPVEETPKSTTSKEAKSEPTDSKEETSDAE